jgi:hypothetical protein
MAAPKNNTYWKQRIKHGRPKLFSSPDQLWNAAVKYFEWCDTNPWNKKDWVAGNIEVIRETPRPYSLYGLCLFLKVGVNYFKQLKRSTAGNDQAYSDIIERIEGVVKTQQLEGAIVGVFEPKIIARELGLMKKKK